MNIIVPEGQVAVLQELFKQAGITSGFVGRVQFLHLCAKQKDDSESLALYFSDALVHVTAVIEKGDGGTIPESVAIDFKVPDDVTSAPKSNDSDGKNFSPGSNLHVEVKKSEVEIKDPVPA